MQAALILPDGRQTRVRMRSALRCVGLSVNFAAVIRRLRFTAIVNSPQRRVRVSMPLPNMALCRKGV